ncbi:hypothetical protein PHMEG_0002432 [Phytophthora megakarya]|uniref:Uncharacterized protein n=1 Tax=Phytophthora megakarya TaxID=4795 RepID=A0A225WZB2_9STRA|nr:hypothetical protein PHMEG_0002432 [Phytophthora megakarya]
MALSAKANITKGKTKPAIAQIQRYYFNADYYVVNDENLNALTKTKARTTKYAKSINGILDVEDKVEDIQLSYQSLHAVDVEHHRALFHNWASFSYLDGFGGNMIRLVCNRFKCDYKMFY